MNNNRLFIVMYNTASVLYYQTNMSHRIKDKTFEWNGILTENQSDISDSRIDILIPSEQIFHRFLQN